MPAASDLRELGRRVQVCREQAHVQPAELARRAQIKLDRLEAFEQGQGGLGMAEALGLARALGVPRASFLHVDAAVPRAYEDPDVLLRNHATHSLEEADRQALRRAVVRADQFVEVMVVTGQPPLRADPTLFRLTPPGDEPYESGYERARTARAALARALPAQAAMDRPLRNLARLLEDHLGILVVERAFQTPYVTEASCRRGPARLIAVDPRPSEVSRRWALAHGLAHQLLDLREEDALPDEAPERFSLDKPPREQRADAFAAMFLAPREAVVRILPRAPAQLGEARQAVDLCRRELGLGFVPMVRQMQDLNLLSPDLADALVTSPGTDVAEGLEEPRLFDGLRRRVLAALEADGITPGRARELDPDLPA